MNFKIRSNNVRALLLLSNKLLVLTRILRHSLLILGLWLRVGRCIRWSWYSRIGRYLSCTYCGWVIVGIFPLQTPMSQFKVRGP